MDLFLHIVRACTNFTITLSCEMMITQWWSWWFKRRVWVSEILQWVSFCILEDDVRIMLKVFNPIGLFTFTCMNWLCFFFSDGVFLFLRKLCSKLDNECHQFLCWINSMQQFEHPVIHKEKHYRQQRFSLVHHILVCVQRVMFRQNSFRTTGKKLNQCFSHIISLY